MSTVPFALFIDTFHDQITSQFSTFRAHNRISTSKKKNNCVDDSKKRKKEIQVEGKPASSLFAGIDNLIKLTLFHHILSRWSTRIVQVRRSHFTSINKQKKKKKNSKASSWIASRQWWCLIRRWFKFYFFRSSSLFCGHVFCTKK